MFTINDGYINALQEALDGSSSKYNHSNSLTSDDLLISNIPDLYNCKYDLEFTDLVVCDHCHTVMQLNDIETKTRQIRYSVDGWNYNTGSYYDYMENGEEDYISCPSCKIGEDEGTEFEYYPLDIEALIYDIDKLKDLEEYTETGFVKAMKEYINKQDDVEVKTEAKEEKKKSEKDDEDFTKLKETVKKEMCKYLKDNGIDVEHLRKTGVELDSMKSVIDKMLDTYVATSIADYENEFNVGLSWDYSIENNDIVISIENM